MASKRTWDDVLRDRGFDPEKRKKQQAVKYADESYISEIEQSEAVRKKQALQSIAKSDAKKALDTLNLLTMGNADKVLASKRITFNAPYVEPIETVQPPIEQEEKKPWYKITGWDLLKGLFKGQKQKKDMTLEERLAADAEYRKMIGGQPAAYLGSKAEEGLMRFHQGLGNAAATLAENIAPESKVTKDLKKTQAGFENWININQELNQPASEGQKILGDVISSTTQMMPSLIIRTFSPIAGDLAFGIPVVGTSAREAELEGANPAQQLAYGLTSGAAETAIERIAFFKPLEKLMPKGVFSDVVKAGTANMKKSLLGIGWDTLKAMGGEAFEEAIADPISGLAKKVIYDHDKPWLGKNGVVDLKAMAYDALIGGITGGVFSLPTMPFNVSDALAVKKYIDENYDATLILAQGLPEEYASHKKAVEYTKNVYPISYNELVDLQNQVATDLKDYAQKVSKKEAVASEPVAPAESKQTEPEKPKPAPEPRIIEQKIESLKNARAKLKEGTPGYEAISRRIAELEKEQKKTDVPADKGNVITPETEITAPAAPERQKPSYKVGDAVAIKSGDTTRTITITEIGTSTVKGVTDNGTPIQYGKKAFENSTVNVVKAQTEPEARTTVQPIPAEKMGNETVMLTNDGTEIKARYVVVSADELITSHNTDMSVNPNYPQELQPRQRERAASIVEVEKMSKNIQPELLGENIKISDGAPIVGDDGIVESGNGRVVALKKMYESGNDAKYREWLEANKDKFGITGELPDKPVLVRVRTTDVDRVAFTKMANESSVAAMSATETARSDAEKMSDDLINLFVPNDEGIINTPENKPFIQRFLNEVVPSNEHARLVTKEGMLSQDGYNRIRNALFYKAYGDLDLLDNLTEDLDADLKNVIKAMVANALKIASIKQGIKEGVLYDLDFSGDIVYAAKKVITLKRTGMKVGEFVNQVSLFGGPTNVQREILAAFEKYNRSAKKINMFIRFISDAVIAAGNPDQIAMFDGITPTKDDIIEYALRGLENELKGTVEGQTTLPVLQTGYEGGTETGRGPKKEEAKTAEVKTTDTKQEKGGIIEEKNTPASKIAEWVGQKLAEDKPFTFAELTKIADGAFEGTQGQGTYSSKDAYDAMELGINKYILENLSDTMKADTEAAKENIQAYREMLGLVPTQTKGNTEQQTHQQFSTPPTIAYVASWIANITKNDTMLEPSAGIGGIAVFAKAAGAKVVVNELSERWLDILKNMPFDEFYNENAEHINDILRDKVRPTVVVMNPPFSATAGRMGNKNSTVNAKAHIEQALEILQDGGRLVAIVGQGMSDKAPAFSDWWKDIKSKYNVRANIGIYKPSEASRIQHTDEYKKYGTDFGVQLLVIDKTGPTKETIATAEPSLEKIIDLLEGVKNDRTAVERDTGTEQVAGSETVQNGAGKGERSDSGRSAAPDTADAVGQRERGTERTGGQEGRTGRQDGARVDNAKSGEKSEVRKPDKRDVVPEGSAETEGQTSETGGTSVERGARTSDGNGSIVETAKVETASKEEQINQVNEDMVYSEYKPQKVRIEGAKPHKSPLVQSTAMASVSPPDVYYTPKIPKKLITSGELTEAQMEAIIYAGQQHEKLNSDGTRKAFFIGDGTGVGKGREVAGIILDNWNRGRKKAVWVTKNGKLYNDAIRDWTALGGNEGDIFKAPANKAIERESGILFTTYHTLPQGKKPNAKTGKAADLNRIDQIVNWLGKDYDGVVIFDESHMMQNLLGKNASEMAQAGSDLQDRLPNARFVYASATGATEVENLAYAKRLGAWGEGTSFYDVNDFVGKIKAGGLAAMELVARDLKAMGLYIARNISFIGVKYDTKTHNLTDIQTEIYDKLAEGWQVVLQNMSKYLEKTGQSKNSRAKAFVMQNFWSTQQRFFNQVLTSMQMPTVIEDMKKRLAAGESCVLQLVNTNAAAEEREVSRIEEEGGSLDDMDITPKGALLEMIDKCFPTQKYEEYIDESGKKHSRPVVDSKGNPVEDSSAIAAKKDLMEQIEKMQIPSSPMDIIFQEFGIENVTEVTGRSRRFVFKRNKFGELERQEERRTEKVVEADVNDFLNDKKQILIFSDAGGTGKSYHAGREFKNQRHRIHYLIQAGWNASRAVQGFGRTHRTNQVSAPEYVLVTTNLKGQKRFISSIARRLDQLGALTKGQRQTGSSGLFSAKDNLESTEARDALEMFYRQLAYNQIPGLKAEEILRKMGLYDKIMPNGVLTDNPEQLRKVTTFLNRILVLTSEEQNQVFDEFMKRLDYVVEEAIKNDRLDVGLENYKSAGATVTEEKIIRTDETGAETKYLAITAKQKAILIPYKEITGRDGFVGFYRSKETGEVRAAIRAVDKTNRDGSISKTYYMQSPTAGKRSHIVESSFNEKWEKINRSEEKILWDKELKNEPPFREEKLHLISGALLPIWNRLPEGHSRVIRITTDDGNSHLGRLVPTHEIDDTLRRLGVSRTKETFDVRDSINKVMKENYLIRLVNRTVISRAKVAGEYRLEIITDNAWALQRQYRGIFDEKIGSSWRYFIPNNEEGIKIIEKITESAPILEVVANRKGENDDVQAFTGTAAEMPRGDDSSKTSKTVDDLIKIVEKHTGVPIRTGKYRQKAHGVFKVQPEVIRTKVRGDVPTISHELGHYFDKKHKFSANNEFKDELLKLGAPVSKSSYSPKDIRSEGVAEFMRLYLTNPILADDKAPLFMAHFEKSIDADTLKFLSMLRREISAIRNLPNNKKIWNDISSGESRRSNTESARLVDRFYDAWIDEDGPFARLQSYVDAKGWEGENLDIMVKLYKGMASKVKSNLYYDQRDLDGNVVGDSLMKILEPLSPKEVKKRTGKRGNSVQEKKDFITYMVSRRAMDYKDRGLAMPQPWYVYEDNIISMEGKCPHFIDVFEGLMKWEDNNLQLLVDSGLKSKNEIEIIKYVNENHVPLHRIRDAVVAIMPNSGNTLGQSRDVLKRAKGSGATIIDPLESIITNSFIIRRAAELNKIYNVIYEMSKLEGIGKMIEVIPPSGRATMFTVQEIRGQLLKSAEAEIEVIKKTEKSEQQKKALESAEAYKEAIKNMTDEQLEAVVSIYRPLYQEKDNQIVAYVGGKKVLMEVDPHLFRAIKGLNYNQAHIIFRLLSKVKNIRVATIVTDMVFVLRNVARDFGTSSMQSEAGIKPWDIIRGYISVATKDKWYKEYLAAGGAIDFGNVYTRRQAQKIEDEVLQYTLPEKAAVFIEALGELRKNNNARTRDKLKNATKDLISMPIDMIRDAVEWSESGARVAEFRKAVEKLGVDKDTAASWGRKLSVDFLRHGYAAKQVNQGIAFFNPNLQGTVRIGETLKSHPLRTFARGFVYITLPTMLLYALNYDDEDYQDLHEYRRALFYNIPIGGGKYIPIPKPPGWGWIFGALPEFAMNKILKDDPEAWEEIMSTFKQSFSLPTEVTAVSPILDILANKRWTGAPVEGQYERQNKPAYLIRDSKTSLLANMIGDIAKNEKGLSPKQIDYLITQYLGNIGATLWQLPDTIKAIKETPDDVTQYPIIKSFITDAAYSSESVNDLYDIGEELDLRRKELMETGEYPAMSHLPLERQKELFVALEGARAEYNQLTEEFENARKAIKEIREDDKYTPAQKKFKERAIRVKMNKMAAEFNEKYRKFKQKHDIK